MKANELKKGGRYYSRVWGGYRYFTGKTEMLGHYTNEGWKVEKCYMFNGQFGGPEIPYTEADLAKLEER